MVNGGHKFTKAWDTQSNEVVDINDLPRTRNGLQCNCVCVDCKQPLEACQGFIKRWYFRHQTKTDCKGGPMTAIHLLAQALLIGEQTIQTEKGEISYTKGTTEFQLPGSGYKSDVAGFKIDGSPFAIEIYVRHRVDQSKKEFYQTNRIHAIEIDLSGVEPVISRADLARLLTHDVTLQLELYAPIAQSITQDGKADEADSWLGYLIVGGILAGLAYFFPRFFSRPSKRRRTRRKY
jgi:hypothetical protein